MMAEEGKSQEGKPREHRSGGRRAKGLCERKVRELGIKSRSLCARDSGWQSS